MEIKSKTLLGIILDCSSSMQSNWKNIDQDIPKIEYIHDSITQQISDLSDLFRRNKDKNKHIFVLGMGFVRPLHFYETRVSYGRESIDDEQKITSTVQNDIVCDLAGLYEIIPNKSHLQEAKNILQNTWRSHADRLMLSIQRNVVIDDLKDALKDNFLIKEPAKLRFNYKYRIYHFLKNRNTKKLFKDLYDNLHQHFLNLDFNQIATNKSIKYSEKIEQKANDILVSKIEDYNQYIVDKLSNFLSDQIAITLDLIVIGHNTISAIKHFDYRKLEEQSNEIYTYLRRDVEKIIGSFWKTFIEEKNYSLNESIDIVNMRGMKDIVVKYMESIMWNELKPSIEETINSLFLSLFEAQFKERLPYWIGVASTREIIKPIGEFNMQIPTTSDINIYTDEFMFGIAAIKEAIDRASLRFLDKKYKRWHKILVIISDGDFSIKNSLFNPIIAASALQENQISIIALCVSDHDIVHKGKLIHDINPGVKLLYEMASPVSQAPWIRENLAKMNINLPLGERLFIQINQSRLLNNILQTILVSEDSWM